MIAKIIAHGEHARAGDRAPAPRGRRHDGGDRRGHHQPGLPARAARPPRAARRRGRHRLARPPAGAGDVQPVRHADAALVQAAIALCDAATADDRAHFYALARRGRPQADADVGHADRPAPPRRELPLRASARSGPAATWSRSTARASRRRSSTSDRARAPALLRRALLPDGDRAAGLRPAGRGQRRPAPHLARRGRAGAQPVARASWSRSRSRRATRCRPATSWRSPRA